MIAYSVLQKSVTLGSGQAVANGWGAVVNELVLVVLMTVRFFFACPTWNKVLVFICRRRK